MQTLNLVLLISLLTIRGDKVVKSFALWLHGVIFLSQRHKVRDESVCCGVKGRADSISPTGGHKKQLAKGNEMFNLHRNSVIQNKNQWNHLWPPISLSRIQRQITSRVGTGVQQWALSSTGGRSEHYRASAGGFHSTANQWWAPTSCQALLWAPDTQQWTEETKALVSWTFHYQNITCA